MLVRPSDPDAAPIVRLAQTVSKLLYDRKSAAYALSISVRSLDYLIANKRLATRKLGKKVMIAAGELSRFARADHSQLSQHPERHVVN